MWFTWGHTTYDDGSSHDFSPGLSILNDLLLDNREREKKKHTVL